MKIALTAAIMAGIVFCMNLPIGFVYSLSILGIIFTLVFLYPVSFLSSSLRELDTLFAEKLYIKWNNDSRASHLILNMWLVLIFQIINYLAILFFSANSYLIMLFLSIGMIILVQQLLVYLRRHYVDDLTILLEDYKNKND